MKIRFFDQTTMEMNFKELKKIEEVRERLPAKNLDLIYNHILLADDEFISFYQIPSAEFVICGRLGEIIDENEIFVEVFLIGVIYKMIHVTVNKYDCCVRVKSILARILPEFDNIKIYNIHGVLINLTERLDVFSDRGYHRMIICWQDNIEIPFEECCDVYNMSVVPTEFPLLVDAAKSQFNVNGQKHEATNCIRERMESCISNDKKLYDLIQELPRPIQDTKWLFCQRIATRIVDEMKWEDFKIQYDEEFNDDDTSEDEDSNGDMEVDNRWENKFQGSTEEEDNVFHIVDCFITELARKMNRNKFLFEKLCGAIWKCSQNINFNGNISNSDEDSLVEHSDTIGFMQDRDKTMKDIVVDVFIDLIDSCLTPNDVRLKSDICLDYVKLGDRSNEEIIENIDKCKNWTRLIVASENELELVVVLRNMTSSQIRKAISMHVGTLPENIMLLSNSGDHIILDADFRPDMSSIYSRLIFDMNDIVKEEKLGEGAFGQVFLCTEKSTDRKLAVKLLKDLTESGSKTLYREIFIMSRLSIFVTPPNIVNAINFYRDRENIYIGLDYMPNGSLKSFLLNNGPLPEARIASICRQILQALKCLHKNNVIHRDLKADNILLDEQYNAKVCDFGLSKLILDLPIDDLLQNLKRYKPGTMYHMSPEILNKEPYTDKTDIWSFGVTVIEMITGNPPYYTMKPIQAVIRICKTRKIDMIPIKDVCNELNELLTSCLKSDPNERKSARKLLNTTFLKNIF